MKSTLFFVHPVSHVPLTREQNGYRCAATGAFFADQNGVPSFVSKLLAEHMNEERTGLINWLKTVLRRWPNFYLFLIFLISPVCFSGVSAKKFLRRFSSDAVLLNIGSGVHKPSPHMLNVDIFWYRGVDIVANAETMPLADNSVDGIVCESLLEHVPNPERIIAEMYRVLKPGGSIYVVIPFVYPFHACPGDYYRCTITGLKEMLSAGTIENIGTRAGPTSALVGQLGVWFGILFSFGSDTLYQIMSLVGLVLFFPLKFLDVILGWLPTSIHGAAQFYAIARKR